jgi:hypothetical protein
VPITAGSKLSDVDATVVIQAYVITDRAAGGAPRLAGERAKALEWLNAGATAVLVLDPRKCSATVYRAGGDVQIASDGTLDLSDAAPGWVVAVADFFA